MSVDVDYPFRKNQNVPDYPCGIRRLEPYGTNSTFFTECCGVAICDDERCCPKCGREIIGADEETDHKRRLIRWKYATQHWRIKNEH